VSDPAEPVLVVVAAVIERDGCFLLTLRLEGTHLAGHWEFPGGKCEPGEDPLRCLEREIREELDAALTVEGEIFRTIHTYPDRRVELRFYRCHLVGDPRPVLGQEMQWVPRQGLHDLNFPPADRELIERLTQKQPAPAA
jgi:8-oxo-dGTP diphosphatase